MTPEQFKLVGHTLGINTCHAELSTRKKDKHLPDEFYRNYYCLGSNRSKPYSDWETLESQDLAHRWTAFDDQLFFGITDRGIQHFRTWFHAKVTLNFIPLSRHKERYQQYMDADCCETFAEWLGIEPPTLNYKRTHWDKGVCIGEGYQYESTKYHSLRGEWRESRKLAKESYKSKLQEYHKERREEKQLRN